MPTLTHPPTLTNTLFPTFYIKGDVSTSRSFLQNTRVFTLAESLGAVESLAELPALMTHAGLTPEDRAELGITDTLVRLSVGIEEEEDIIADLAQALEKAVCGFLSVSLSFSRVSLSFPRSLSFPPRGADSRG